MKKFILFALVVSFSIIATLTNSSSANELIVFTELSSTELKMGNSLVTNLGPDHWHFSLGPGVPQLGSLNAYWIEPEDSSLGNVIKIAGANGFDIFSDFDVSTFPSFLAHADGTIITSQVGLKITQDTSIFFDVQFFDKGDAATAVPEPSTMLLLGCGLIGLAGYGRKKFFKK